MYKYFDPVSFTVFYLMYAAENGYLVFFIIGETRVNSTRSTTTTNTSTVIVAIAIAGCIVSAMVAVIVISCILVLLYRKRKGSKYTTNSE